MLSKSSYYDWHPETHYGLLEEIAPLQSCTRILDVGCGTGWFAAALKRYSPTKTVVGVDTNLDGLAKSQGRLLPIRASAVRLPFRKETFDGVAAKAVLEHLVYAAGGVIEFHRVLKRGGRVLVSVPDVNSRHFWDDYTHVRPFTKKSLNRLLEENGFLVERMWYTCSMPGLGILLRMSRAGDETPLFLKALSAAGIGRDAISCVATKA
jgi:SAM-dependent methyltransferase